MGLFITSYLPILQGSESPSKRPSTVTLVIPYCSDYTEKSFSTTTVTGIVENDVTFSLQNKFAQSIVNQKY